MSNGQVTFSETTLKEYMKLHTQVVELKYAFLKIVQSPSVTDAAKQALKEELVGLADVINAHFVDLAGREVNSFNLDDFEFREHQFIKQVQQLSEQFMRLADKTLPVKIRYLLHRLYRFCLAMIQKQRGEQAERSRRVDEEMKARVSSALDDLL